MIKISPQIFRAYDIRGIFPKEVNEDIFKKIGFVVGEREKKFFVGGDIRKSSKKLALALISGLLKKKSKVYFSEKTSFGLCLFSGFKLNVEKTLFVTASHLPPEWNGLKIYFGDGEPISSKEIEKIRDRILNLKEKISFLKPKFEKVNSEKEYIETLFKKFPLLKGNNLKVVLDCGGGATSLIAPKIFKRFDFKVIELFCKVDPSFSFRPSEPTLEATKVLRERVKKEKADFGVAFDGDGDRAVIVDDKGNYLGGNEVGIILAKEILSSSKNKKIVKTVACSQALEEELKKFGAKIIEVPVGHTFVICAVKKKKAILGIEESSHFVLPQYFLFDDGILVPLKIAEILIKRKKKLSEILKEVKIYLKESFEIFCPDEKKFEVINELKKELKRRYKRVSTLDGIKVYFDFGSVLIRASNTSPKIRLYIEAKTQKKLKFLKEKFTKFLKSFL